MIDLDPYMTRVKRGRKLILTPRVLRLAEAFHNRRQSRSGGMKFDAGKPMAGLMVSDFANALLAVSEVTTFGAKKYAPRSWMTVPNARDRYNDALHRHLLMAAAGEKQDQESKLLHAAHVAWNALALLELEIRK